MLASIDQKPDLMEELKKEGKEKNSLAIFEKMYLNDPEFRDQSKELIDKHYEEVQVYTKKMTDKINNAANQHEKLNVLNEMLEGILESVKPPEEEFRDIDTRPKHLLHMTEEDMLPKAPEILREELNELIKEAKQKIKPVLMTQFE